MSLHDKLKKDDKLMNKIEQQMKDEEDIGDNFTPKEIEKEVRLLKMSRLHENPKGDDHHLLKKIKQEKNDDHQEEKDNVLQKEIKQETKDDYQEERNNALLKEIKQEIMKEYDHQEERGNALLKEIKEEKEAERSLFEKQKRDYDDDDQIQIPFSYYEKLMKKIDDGSLDAVLENIKMLIEKKQRKEDRLTEIALQRFRRRLDHLNADRDRQETKLKASEQVAEAFKSYMEQVLQATSKPVCVIEKRLTDSDLNVDTDQSGLSIPKARINTHQFLSEQEIKKIEKDQGELKVILLEFCENTVEETKLKLKNLGTDYVLTDGQNWNVVKRRNEERFRRADGVKAVIQLWSFRNKSSLYFAIFVVEEEP